MNGDARAIRTLERPRLREHVAVDDDVRCRVNLKVIVDDGHRRPLGFEALNSVFARDDSNVGEPGDRSGWKAKFDSGPC